MIPSADVSDLLRELTPQVLGALTRRHGRFDACEDALQEALVAAAESWPADGVPANPQGWLITIATRRLIDSWRSDSARRRREEAAAARTTTEPGQISGQDDTLLLLVLCCHPALTIPAQLALTLRAVGGLTTAEIARGLLLPEATVAQRISRAKARIKASGAGFSAPSVAELRERMPAVTHVLYLIFNEGYTASSGSALNRGELTREALRLTRVLHASVPDDGEVSGLLALMLLTEARRPARTRADGSIVPLAEQDRRLWSASAISEGVALISATLATAPPGPYQLQAAIAAVHDEAAHADDTDWPQILALYDVLSAIAPGPMVTLNRIVAVAMVRGPGVALDQLDSVDNDPALQGHHRVDAVRAHLLEQTGKPDSARAHYLLAAQRTLSLPERRYLLDRASRAN